MLRRTLRVLMATALFVAAAPLTASAHDDAEFEARLDPGQEVAAVVSDGEGEAEFTLRRNKIRFKLEWEDLTSDVVFAHIHCAAKGVNGPIGVTLIHEQMDPDGRARGSFTAPDPGNGCGWATLADVVGALASGEAYVNVHTVNFQSGEIRGQIKPEDLEFEAELDPKQEVSPVVSKGEGEAEFTIRRNKVRFKLEWEDLTSDVLFAHIHCNVAGVNGPVGVTLIHEMMDDEGRVRGSFTGPDPGNGCNWDSLGDVLRAMASGRAYVNVHTVNFQGGEIRGQVEID